MQKIKYLILLTLFFQFGQAWSFSVSMPSERLTNTSVFVMTLSGCDKESLLGTETNEGVINVYIGREPSAIDDVTSCSLTDTDVEIGPFASGSYIINYYISDLHDEDPSFSLQDSQTVTFEKASENEPPVGRIVINGEAIEDQVISVSHNIDDANGMGEVEYQWYRNGEPLPGEVGETYLLTDDDIRQRVWVTASYVDGLENTEHLSSVLVGAPGRIANINDEPIGSAYIRGTVAEGSTLTIDTSGLYDADGIESFSYQWQRGYNLSSAAGEAIGSNSDTYVPTEDDRFQEITAVVSYRDSHGTYERVETNITGPVVSTDRPIVIPPADLSLPATGILTPVNQVKPVARDDQGETFSTSLILLSNGISNLASDKSLLRPGTHLLTWWHLGDGRFISSEAIQIVRLDPIIAFGGDSSNSPAGPFSCPLVLNGAVARYPVTVPYTLSGIRMADQGEQLLYEGTLKIHGNEQKTAIRIPGYIVGDTTQYQSLTLLMDQPTNAVMGDKSSCRIVLSEQNFPPQVALTASQEGEVYRIVSQTDGLVSVTSVVEDMNIDDTHTYDWSETDQGLTDIDTQEATLTFDPASLEPGLYRVRLRVGDGAVIRDAELSLRVVAARPVLTVGDSDGDGETDLDEGEGDRDSDGIPDYLDHAGLLGNFLPQLRGFGSYHIIETEPGLELALGDIAFYAHHHGAMITEGDFHGYVNGGLGGATDSQINPYEGGLFDFRIDGIAEVGSSARVVIPLWQWIEADYEYRKLTVSGWQTFIENDANGIKLAFGSAAFGGVGECPPPGDSDYTEVLMGGAFCVELTIEDGGPNDADGEANGMITHTGGVRKTLSDDDSGSDSQNGGGGGAFSLWALLLLVLFALTYRSGSCLCRQARLTR